MSTNHDDISNSVDALNRALDNATPVDAQRIYQDATGFLQLLDDGETFGECCPLVVVDKVRRLRDKANAIVTFAELTPNNSISNTRRMQRIAAKRLGQ